ncbi:MAG TPA: rRNA (guanine-N1)-methyltransferase [Pseudonocardiaceae bacterium]|jgi:23S rRNA (guanine745-N1)-methyltransferase|nr:rRNA (guanine-N1)-methyltransferase [Pseudonocardiaceae bacterium]
MIADVLTCLRCPICGNDLTQVGNTVHCPAGHSYDLARQGYLNLLGAASPNADTAEMVAARAEFLGAGHYAPLVERLAALAAEIVPDEGIVLDAGASIGHYLTAVLDAVGDRPGLALDLSAVALRRAARAHPRIGAVVWDIWRPWPVRDGCAGLVLNVFAPRNGAEFRRVLRADGALLVVTPGPAHLAELGPEFGMLTVDPDKDRRLAASLDEHFAPTARETLTVPLTLTAQDAAHLVRMGPSAHHLTDDQRNALDASTEPVTATASFTLSTYTPLAV